VIGDLRSVALVGVNGTIDWYCCPRFDAPSVFGAILDSAEGGHYGIAPIGEPSTRQMYMPDTNVLITRFLSAAGVGEVQDFMVVDDGPQRLVRRVTCISGSLGFRLECEPRFNYGRGRHDISLTTESALFTSSELALALHGPASFLPTRNGVVAEFQLSAGQTAARAGRVGEARLAFEKMLTFANHPGLYSEEIGSSGEQLGNFPEAFTHLALISAAVNLDRKHG
jgi:GH15 family glucan-1,4-alpha-glucosidase